MSSAHKDSVTAQHARGVSQLSVPALSLSYLLITLTLGHRLVGQRGATVSKGRK